MIIAKKSKGVADTHMASRSRKAGPRCSVYAFNVQQAKHPRDRDARRQARVGRCARRADGGPERALVCPPRGHRQHGRGKQEQTTASSAARAGRHRRTFSTPDLRAASCELDAAPHDLHTTGTPGSSIRASAPPRTAASRSRPILVHVFSAVSRPKHPNSSLNFAPAFPALRQLCKRRSFALQSRNGRAVLALLPIWYPDSQVASSLSSRPSSSFFCAHLALA
ncbi:hypothetical protein BOTBODRAFT_223701 [Botryobasidium botryosum FD-172 SS1]|uniref:Uncharacterized protein n=1 Tax=Botryobasidium botryosum (strain FD-172 SS1) TaxID=930990 RepID=A0A067MMN1_BOTB1|nr:hypothetical protein BOTBODRAFT_223701 [Botryobasidium botryosum FD-172 SS1]